VEARPPLTVPNSSARLIRRERGPQITQMDADQRDAEARLGPPLSVAERPRRPTTCPYCDCAAAIAAPHLRHLRTDSPVRLHRRNGPTLTGGIGDAGPDPGRLRGSPALRRNHPGQTARTEVRTNQPAARSAPGPPPGSAGKPAHGTDRKVNRPGSSGKLPSEPVAAEAQKGHPRMPFSGS
jgi:hypothetical protein